jgi:hypothetical protein
LGKRRLLRQPAGGSGGGAGRQLDTNDAVWKNLALSEAKAKEDPTASAFNKAGEGGGVSASSVSTMRGNAGNNWGQATGHAGVGTCSQIPLGGRGGTGSETVMVRIPADLTCTHCVMQWHWTSGNSCPGNLACASSEQFWNCMDLQITGGTPTPPPAPTQRPTPAPALPTSPPTPPPTRAPTAEPDRCEAVCNAKCGPDPTPAPPPTPATPGPGVGSGFTCPADNASMEYIHCVGGLLGRCVNGVLQMGGAWQTC